MLCLAHEHSAPFSLETNIKSVLHASYRHNLITCPASTPNRLRHRHIVLFTLPRTILSLYGIRLHVLYSNRSSSVIRVKLSELRTYGFFSTARHSSSIYAFVFPTFHSLTLCERFSHVHNRPFPYSAHISFYFDRKSIV